MFEILYGREGFFLVKILFNPARSLFNLDASARCHCFLMFVVLWCV